MVGPSDLRQIWDWLEEVPDPEVPAVSVVDLGIVRDIHREPSGRIVVTITPTYSGCPATAVIAADIEETLHARGIKDLSLQMRLAPAWTTDWISESGRRKLVEYGIAPPAPCGAPAVIFCPRCGSGDTEVISQFGSTPCKALHRCRRCREPFDYFKCH